MWNIIGYAIFISFPYVGGSHMLFLSSYGSLLFDVIYQRKYYFCDFSLIIGLAYFHFKLTFMSNAPSYVRYMYCNICRRFGQFISLGIKLYCYNFKALYIVCVQKVYSLFCLLCETGLYCPSRVCPTYWMIHCKKTFRILLKFPDAKKGCKKNTNFDGSSLYRYFSSVK